MYKTCIYCNRNLGTNEVVEHFPVGRQLAFDQEKGRLWVICEACRRWNLTPLEERWEAIEECERQFYDTSQSYSTDNIGLAHLPQGLQLVRIGRPKRREFAAWRYGREFWQRRVRSVISTAVQLAFGVVSVIAGANILPAIIAIRQNRVVARVRDDKDRRLFITPKEAKRAKLYRGDSSEEWSVEVSYRPAERTFLAWNQGKGKRQTVVLSGPTAIRVAGHILPHVNEWGATDAQVCNAVELIEEARNAERLFAQIAPQQGAIRTQVIFEVDATKLTKLDSNARLALEMVAHEDSERRALEGELALLEQAWRDAEEIAAIADRLAIPEPVEDLLEVLKQELRR